MYVGYSIIMLPLGIITTILSQSSTCNKIINELMLLLGVVGITSALSIITALAIESYSETISKYIKLFITIINIPISISVFILMLIDVFMDASGCNFERLITYIHPVINMIMTYNLLE